QPSVPTCDGRCAAPETATAHGDVNRAIQQIFFEDIDIKAGFQIRYFTLRCLSRYQRTNRCDTAGKGRRRLLFQGVSGARLTRSGREKKKLEENCALREESGFKFDAEVAEEWCTWQGQFRKSRAF